MPRERKIPEPEKVPPARFMIPAPVRNGPRWGEGQTLFTYMLDDGRSAKWSAPFPIPDVGTRVYITLNNIGWARVEGYFVEWASLKKGDRYVGVMTRAENPPAWLARQREEVRKKAALNPDPDKYPQWVLDGVGCEYGTEISLTEPEKSKGVGK